MKISAFIVTGLMLLLWDGIFGMGMWVSLREEKGQRKWFGAVGCLMVMMGVTSFFLTGLVADCGIDIVPARFEWPMGYADGILTTPRGKHIVGHNAANRVQIYDENWNFIRGWHVEGLGGGFNVALLPNELFEVFTVRGNSRFVYALDGSLVSTSTYSPKTPSPPPAPGESRWFWSWPWMWPLVNPFIAMLTMVLGFVILFIGGHATFRFARKRTR
jgi:hypothetical protein